MSLQNDKSLPHKPISDEERENQAKEKSREKFRDFSLYLTVFTVTTILVQLLIAFEKVEKLLYEAIIYWSIERIQFAVNITNIIVSSFAMIFFVALYRKTLNSTVEIKNIDEYEKITDPPNESILKEKIKNNPIRVENLVSQYLVFIILFAFSLVAVYSAIIIEPHLPHLPIPPLLTEQIAFYKEEVYREITPFFFLTNIINFIGALFIYLGFKVLHDDTLKTDNVSWTFFWVYPICIFVIYTLVLGLLCLSYSNLSYSNLELNHAIKRFDTIFLNLADLVAGVANGLAMTLLFGRYVSIEQSLRDTKLADVRRKIFTANVPYKLVISIVIIYIMPIYALAQLLFGSLTIDSIGTSVIFQTSVYFVCLIGKIFFFVLTYLLIKKKLLHLYLHGVVAKVGNFKGMEKCLNFNDKEVVKDKV